MMNLLKRILPTRQIGSSRISSPKIAPKSPKRKQGAHGVFSFLVFICIFGVVFGLLWWADQYYRIREVRVLGATQQYGFRGEQVMKGMRTWQFDAEEQKKYLAQANPYYEIIDVQKTYPGTIVIEVRRHIPAAYLDTGEGFFLLSSTGSVLEKTREISDTHYPLITFYQRIPFTGYQRGDDIGLKEVTDSLYFLDALHNAKIAVNHIDIGGFHMLGLYTEENTFLFSSEKDIERQRYMLEQALIQFGVEGTKFQTLDVRFDKPVVRF